MNSDHYTSEVFWSAEDEGYIAIAPALPGCSAFGETRSEAITELDFAIEAWKASAMKSGNPIPTPRERPGFESHSGKVSLRMPKELHADLSRQAKEQNVSLNQHMCYLLTKNHCSSTAVADVLRGMQMKMVAFNSGNISSKIFQFGTVMSSDGIPKSIKSSEPSTFIPLSQIQVQSNV